MGTRADGLRVAASYLRLLAHDVDAHCQNETRPSRRAAIKTVAFTLREAAKKIEDLADKEPPETNS